MPLMRFIRELSTLASVTLLHEYIDDQEDANRKLHSKKLQISQSPLTVHSLLLVLAMSMERIQAAGIQVFPSHMGSSL